MEDAPWLLSQIVTFLSSVFSLSFLDTPSMCPVRGLQCFSTWAMKFTLRKSSKIFLSRGKLASSPDIRAAATIWICCSSAACRTLRCSHWHHGTSDSLLKMTTADKKHCLEVSMHRDHSVSFKAYKTITCWLGENSEWSSAHVGEVRWVNLRHTSS